MDQQTNYYFVTIYAVGKVLIKRGLIMIVFFLSLRHLNTCPLSNMKRRSHLDYKPWLEALEMLVLPTLNFIMQGMVFFGKFLCSSLPLAASILYAFVLSLEFLNFWKYITPLFHWMFFVTCIVWVDGGSLLLSLSAQFRSYCSNLFWNQLWQMLAYSLPFLVEYNVCYKVFAPPSCLLELSVGYKFVGS